jgi:hypothetical protein
MWLLFFILLSAAPVCADVSELDDSETELEAQRHASVQSGYRFVTPDGPTAAASPYGRLKSGVTGGLSAGFLGSDLKLVVDGTFLHEDDYNTELSFDYRGQIRLSAGSMALWHNLLRDQVNPGTLTLLPRDQNVTYGVRTAITQADSRIKLGNNPFHLNIGYWELTRDGYEQLRYSDHYFGAATSSIITESNRVNRITREGSVGLDAHLELFDLSYGFRIRDFSNQAADPRYTFTNTGGGAFIPGYQAHDAIPDSRVTSHTIKLFSDLSGGLVGSASYNLTQRENTGGHGEAVLSEHPSDLIHSVSGDLTYTPSKRHSFAFKYRHREIDRTTPSSLYYMYSRIPAAAPEVYTATPGLLQIRPASSSVKDTLTFSATFRPAPKVIYRLEYNAELESRDNVLNSQATAGSVSQLHSDSRQTHTGTASFFWKPVNGLKLNATYSFASSDNPSYGSSFSDQHIGKLLLTYTGNPRWGASGSYIARQESIDNSSAQVSTLPRSSRSDSVNAAVWFSPVERLVLTTSYSFLNNDTDQTILFTSLSLGSLAATNYRSQAHVYGIDAMYSPVETLDFSASFQQVRSSSRFSVPPLADATYSSEGITGLTKLDSTETGVSARIDWRVTSVLGCAVDYNFRRYESGQPIYDGSVHSTMVTLKARW